MQLRKIHRWLGISIGALWIFQALTGALLVFRCELDDALLAGPAVAFDAQRLAERAISIDAAHGDVRSVWTSGSETNRFDIYYRDSGGADRTMRVDGAGRVLRDQPDSDMISGGAIFNTLTTLHTSLFAGRAGEWIVAASGLVLLANLFVGVKLAWPRAQRWRDALFASSAGAGGPRVVRWHRAIGLWATIPLTIIVACGVALVFRPELTHWLRADIVEPRAQRPVAGSPRWIEPGEALRVASAVHSNASLTAVVWPEQESPWYRVRLRTPAEGARIWGTTTVFVDATDGRVLADYPAAAAPPARALADSLYPLHTGQQAGWALRAVALAVTGLLIALIVLGWRRAITTRTSNRGS